VTEKLNNWFNSYFKLEENKTTVRTEVLAGITSFITIAYILILNLQIISHPYEIMGDMEMVRRISNGVFIGTCIASFVGTVLCALYARVPFIQAPGMDLNAFFAYTVVLAMGYSYSQSLVVVFVSGVLFIIITKIGLREAIIRAIPDSVIMLVISFSLVNMFDSIGTLVGAARQSGMVDEDGEIPAARYAFITLG